MKLNFNKKYTTIAIYACLVILFTMFCIYMVINDATLSNIFNKIKEFMIPILIGLLITYLVNPIYNIFDRKIFAFISKSNKGNLEKKLALKHVLSLVLSYIIMLGLVVCFFWIVIPELITSINALTEQVKSYIGPIRDFVMGLDDRTDMLGTLYQYAKPYIKEGDIINSLPTLITTLMSQLSGFLIEMISGTVSVIKYLLLGLFFSIYFLLYKKQTETSFNRLLSAFFSEKLAHFIRHIVELVDTKFGHFLKGQSLDSLIIACITWLVLTILGYKYAILIALVVGVTNMIPVFGPFLGAVPSALLILITEENPLRMTVIFVVFVLVLQQIDGNILVPLILGDAIGLSPLWILISITVMGSLFGVLGMFIGVPTFAVIYTLISEAITSRLGDTRKIIEVIPVYDDTVLSDGEQISMIDDSADADKEEASSESDSK